MAKKATTKPKPKTAAAKPDAPAPDPDRKPPKPEWNDGCTLEFTVTGGSGIAEVVFHNGKTFQTKKGDTTSLALAYGLGVTITPVAIK